MANSRQPHPTKPGSPGRSPALKVVWLAALWAMIVPALAAPTITLQKQAQVEGTVTLADIAKIEADGETEMGEITIGSSPLAGRSRIVSAKYVRMRIARADFEDFALEGAESVKLVAKGALRSNTRTRQHQSQQSAENTEKPPPPVIERSQRVQVTLFNHGVVISAAGRAMADAALNQPVPVRISSTHQQIQGTAAENGRVLVRLEGRSR